MKNIPKTIYLQVDADGETPDDFNELEVTWCTEKIHDNDISYFSEAALREAAYEACGLYRETQHEKLIAQSERIFGLYIEEKLKSLRK